MRCLVDDLGANVNQVDEIGISSLHIAMQHSKLHMVRLLITELGADLGADHDGATPLLFAATIGNIDMVRYLTSELGVDVNQANADGSTPLIVAAVLGRLAMVRFLVSEHGADVNQAEQYGGTPLIMATQEGNLDIVRYLIMELGADINQAANEGRTPLMVAAQVNNQALLKHLIHKGALVRAVSKAEHKAITLLKSSGATTAQIAYLEVRECCANPGCDGGGRKRCCVCKATRYCGMACRVAHWRVHRGGCRLPSDTEGEGVEVAS
jgi:ankyrin repeat protein